MDVPPRAGRSHRVFGSQLPPSQMEALLVAIDMLEDEIGMRRVPQGHPQFDGSAPLVDQILPRLKRPFVRSMFDHVVHTKDFPDVGLEGPAGVVRPEDDAGPQVEKAEGRGFEPQTIARHPNSKQAALAKFGKKRARRSKYLRHR